MSTWRIRKFGDLAVFPHLLVAPGQGGREVPPFTVVDCKAADLKQQLQAVFSRENVAQTDALPAERALTYKYVGARSWKAYYAEGRYWQVGLAKGRYHVTRWRRAEDGRGFELDDEASASIPPLTFHELIDFFIVELRPPRG